MQCDGGLVVCCVCGYVWFVWYDDGQWIWLESVYQLLCGGWQVVGKGFGVGGVEYVDDQWVVVGLVFGGEDFGDGCILVGLCGQVVDCFGWQFEQFVVGQVLCGSLDGVGVVIGQDQY